MNEQDKKLCERLYQSGPTAECIQAAQAIERLSEQRDELLAALEELNSVSARGFLYDDPARVKARAAIAKVKGCAA